MKRVLVIGIGSLVMKDDGIGARVVEAIEGSLREQNIASLVGETDFASCFDAIQQHDFLILIDAMVQGKDAGSIDVMRLNHALRSRGKLRTQHEFSLFDLIQLHYPKIEGYFIGIEAVEIGFGFDLSAPLQERFEQICADVLNIVLDIKEEAEHA